MNYIDEYIQNLNELKQGNKTKFDVCFIIPEPMKSFCVGLNNELDQLSHSEIVMGDNSIIFPHISLFMGYVDSYKMLDEVFDVVSSYAKETQSFSLDFDKLYFKAKRPSAPQYLFVDSLQNDYLMQQKERFHDQLSDIVYPLEWNMKAERAHITIGCYKNLNPDMRKMINKSFDFPQTKISQIGVSLTGLRGVCLSTLKTFDLIG